MTDQFKKGDIIQGTRRLRSESYHPILYLAEIDDYHFLGGMITHSKQNENIPLEESHFKVKIDENPKPSYIVSNYLIKKHEWGPYKLIGELTTEGIHYIEQHLEQTEPQIWENYLAN